MESWSAPSESCVRSFIRGSDRCSPATGKDRYGLTFEERLAREFGTSTTYIRLTFSKWLGDIFDGAFHFLHCRFIPGLSTFL